MKGFSFMIGQLGLVWLTNRKTERKDINIKQTNEQTIIDALLTNNFVQIILVKSFYEHYLFIGERTAVLTGLAES